MVDYWPVNWSTGHPPGHPDWSITLSKPYPRSPKPLIYIETTPPPSRPLNWSIGGRWVVDYWPVNWSTGHPPVHFPST